MTFKSRSNKILNVNDPNVVKQFPMWGKGDALYIWAERGLICWEDPRTDGGYGTMKWRDAAERVLALSQMVINSSEDRRWSTERIKLQNFVNDMEKVIRQAKEQGGPDDPDSIAEARRRKKRASMVKPREIDNTISGDPTKSPFAL